MFKPKSTPPPLSPSFPHPENTQSRQATALFGLESNPSTPLSVTTQSGAAAVMVMDIQPGGAGATEFLSPQVGSVISSLLDFVVPFRAAFSTPN